MPKIMIVDDEAVITTQLEESLTDMGYDVVGVAFSGDDAIPMARRHHPDIILMDIVMPGRLDGIEASKIIQTEMDIPVIFLSAYADDHYIDRAKEVGPFGYVIKPFQQNEIKAVIEVALSKKSMEKALRSSEQNLRSGDRGVAHGHRDCPVPEIRLCQQGFCGYFWIRQSGRDPESAGQGFFRA